MGEFKARKEHGGEISLLCGCCGKEKLGEIKEGMIVIRDRRHGKAHTIKIPVDKKTQDAIVAA